MDQASVRTPEPPDRVPAPSPGPASGPAAPHPSGPAAPHPSGGPVTTAPAEPTTEVRLARVTWSVTAIGFVAAGIVLLVEGYYGYAAVALVVAASALVNVL